MKAVVASSRLGSHSHVENSRSLQSSDVPQRCNCSGSDAGESHSTTEQQRILQEPSPEPAKQEHSIVIGTDS